MADELDPILEARLRGALKSEADAVPFTLRADTIRRVGAERRRARNSQRLSWMAAAAVVVVGLVGIAAVSALRAPNQVASPTMPALPSYDQLLAAGLGGPEIARSEGAADSVDGQWQLGVTSVRTSIEIVIACAGPGPVTVSTTGRESWPVGTAPCDGQPVSLRDRADPNLAYADSPTIMAEVPVGTAFRYVVLGEPGSTPDAVYPVETPDANGLATYTALKQQLEAGGDVTATLTGEHLVAQSGEPLVTWDLGTISGLQGEFAATCVGKPVLVGFGDGRQFVTSREVDCGRFISTSSLVADLGSGEPAHLMVQAMPSAKWRVVGGIPSSPVTTEAPTASASATASDAASSAPSAHRSPTVACQPAPTGQNVPPAVSLYKGGAELGIGNYYTFAWGTTSADGAPTVGDWILDGGDGHGLVVRIDGDVCAIAWSVVYGTAGETGSVGITKVGDLAVQSNALLDPAVASENRIALADLPKGDWVVDVGVQFANGDGHALFRVSVGTPLPSATPAGSLVEPSLAPAGKGETVLKTLDLTNGDGTTTWTGARPAGTDEYRLWAACTGEGSIVLTIDGVSGQWACGSIGVEEFTLGPGDHTTFQATVTGGARFKVRLDAYDGAKAGFWTPPKLSLSGQDWTAGDTVTVAGAPGCGAVWEPKSGQGGGSDSCGPSWQAIASPLHQRPGTSVALALPSGWTIDAVTMSYAANGDILPARSPASQTGSVTSSGGLWSFMVPPVGDWGVLLTVSASHGGDHMQVPYYSRVIVEP